MSPLQQLEQAHADRDRAARRLAEFRLASFTNVSERAAWRIAELQLETAQRSVRRARIRVALSGLAYLVVASVGVAILWGLTVLLTAALDGTPFSILL